MSNLLILQTSVDSWLTRDDVAVTGADWPAIQLLVESRLARDLRLTGNEASTTLVFTGRSQDLPADFIEIRNPFIDDTVRKFEYKTPQAIRESASWANGRAGMFYTLEGSPDPGAPATNDDRVKMTIAGPASALSTISVEVNYWRRFPTLVNPTDSNWLLLNHFDIYLYATLTDAAIYIQELELASTYGQLYMSAIQQQNKLENRKRYAAVPKQAYANPRGVI